MPCGACACCCNAGGEGAMEQLLGASADLENGRRTETTTADDPVNEIVFLVGHRITKFIARGLLILLWVYLYNSMRRYAVSYIGEDTWFTTFAVIVIAVPLAEIFCIVGQLTSLPPPRSFELWPRPFPWRK